MTTAITPDRSTARAELRSWLPSFLMLAVIWGTSFLFIKVGVRELHPLWLTFGRVAAGTAILLVILAVTRDRLPRDPRLWGHLFVVAALGVAIPFTLFGFGEQRVSSVLAGIWNAATPLVALPLAVLAFRTERMNARRAVGIGVGFVGVLVVLGAWRGVGGAQLTGQLMCFGAAMCYAICIPYQKKFVAGRTGSGVSLVTAQLLLALLQLAIVAPLLAGAPPAPGRLSGQVIICVLLLGTLGTGVAFILNFRVIRVAGASTSTSVTYLMPIVATIAGVTVLGESLTWNQPVGALVVLLGVAVSQGALTGLLRRRSVQTGPDVPEAEPSRADPPGPDLAGTELAGLDLAGPELPEAAVSGEASAVPPPRAAAGR